MKIAELLTLSFHEVQYEYVLIPKLCGDVRPVVVRMFVLFPAWFYTMGKDRCIVCPSNQVAVTSDVPANPEDVANLFGGVSPQNEQVACRVNGKDYTWGAFAAAFNGDKSVPTDAGVCD